MASSEALYQQAIEKYGAALERLARGYEADADKRRDLLQEIHVALWRSFSGFDERCSLRTWVYRVAHNRAISHIRASYRHNPGETVEVETAEIPAETESHEAAVDRTRAREHLMALVQQLGPLDRQVVLLYLEGMDAASIGEIVGLSATNIGSKVHRLKALLIAGVRREGKYVD